jgi:hypothetical protein
MIMQVQISILMMSEYRRPHSTGCQLAFKTRRYWQFYDYIKLSRNTRWYSNECIEMLGASLSQYVDVIPTLLKFLSVRCVILAHMVSIKKNSCSYSMLEDNRCGLFGSRLIWWLRVDNIFVNGFLSVIEHTWLMLRIC